MIVKGFPPIELMGFNHIRSFPFHFSKTTLKNASAKKHALQKTKRFAFVTFELEQKGFRDRR